MMKRYLILDVPLIFAIIQTNAPPEEIENAFMHYTDDEAIEHMKSMGAKGVDAFLDRSGIEISRLYVNVLKSKGYMAGVDALGSSSVVDFLYKRLGKQHNKNEILNFLQGSGQNIMSDYSDTIPLTIAIRDIHQSSAVLSVEIPPKIEEIKSYVRGVLKENESTNTYAKISPEDIPVSFDNLYSINEGGDITLFRTDAPGDIIHKGLMKYLQTKWSDLSKDEKEYMNHESKKHDFTHFQYSLLVIGYLKHLGYRTAEITGAYQSTKSTYLYFVVAGAFYENWFTLKDNPALQTIKSL